MFRIGKKIITPTAVPAVPGATGECPLPKPVARKCSRRVNSFLIFVPVKSVYNQAALFQ